MQDLVQTLPLALLGRRPFMPARVPIRPEHHYRAQLAFLPAFGVAEWLLMGAAAHGLLRLLGGTQDPRRVLDVIGLGMAVPMPALWTGDVVLLTLDRFRMPELGFVNVPVQARETALFVVGLRTALRQPAARAILPAVAAGVVYVLGASQLVR